MELCVSDTNHIVIDWYSKLNTSSREMVSKAGFEPLINGLSISKVMDIGLIQSLAHNWWDSTHTFHFQRVGEMTMTPMDFSAITGLRVKGIPLLMHQKSIVDAEFKNTLLGSEIIAWEEDRVSVNWLSEIYSSKKCATTTEEHQIVRAFILALIGCSILPNEQNTVDLDYLGFLEDIENVSNYNWGAAALAYQYNQMDDLCRANITYLRGLWKSWEVS